MLFFPSIILKKIAQIPPYPHTLHRSIVDSQSDYFVLTTF